VSSGGGTGAKGSSAMSKAAANLPEPELDGVACTMRPGDVGFEECEACQ
jgi:ribonucleoside-diphosphate reductase alpha chain